MKDKRGCLGPRDLPRKRKKKKKTATGNDKFATIGKNQKDAVKPCNIDDQTSRLTS